MDSANKISTLEERAIIQLAVKISQENSFKELVLRLAKPTYGHFLPGKSTFVSVSDQKNFSIWVAKMEELPWYKRYHLDYNSYAREQQDVPLEMECQRLTKELPHLLRDRVRTWINRIALEYRSYRCRLELLFGVSRYFLMTFLNIGDWKGTGRLDEKNVALRLLDDEQLTVFQKYQIACVYCLHEHIPELWKRLTEEEISLIRKDLESVWDRVCWGRLMPDEGYKAHNLVLLWSFQMIREVKKKPKEEIHWTCAAKQATYYGNRVALSLCWEKLNEETRNKIVVEMALEPLERCAITRNENLHRGGMEELEEISWPNTGLAENVFDFRSHHAELVLFFLSQMDEEQKLVFLKKAIESLRFCNVLECFLDWPLQHELLPMINRSWGIITNDMYRKCIFSLAEKCSENSTKENHIDDYRGLFRKLWERTPEELKQFVFNGERDSFHLLYYLLKRSPFQKEDKALFNRVFSDLAPERRREMMLSSHGGQIISNLLEEGKWPLLNWFLQEYWSKEEISSFKKKFIKSVFGCNWCLMRLVEYRESFVKDVIDWCFEFESEKSQFKCELMGKEKLPFIYSSSVFPLLGEGEFAEVERMINFCVSSEEMKEEIKANCALCTCKELLGRYRRFPKWEKMDKILSWSSSSDDRIRDIKKYLLHQNEGINSHFMIVFIEQNQEELERFYKWFDLSPEEIEDHKHIIFNDRYLSELRNVFLFDSGRLVKPLRWFLTDEEKVIRFIERFKRTLEQFSVSYSRELLDDLESELLSGLREEEEETEDEDEI